MGRQVTVVTNKNVISHIPSATYRVQFNRHFMFRDAAQLVPYWDKLGISHCYASPYFKAVPGSLHGYDLVDPASLNPEVGTEEEYAAFAEALRKHGMGQILDVVPNHMGIGKMFNDWWLDVLENGPSSPYSMFFDIDWDPVKRELHDKVLLPILGDLYGRALENQELQLQYEDGGFVIRYFDVSLPVAPRPWIAILSCRMDTLVARLGPSDPRLLEFQSIITALGHLPFRNERDTQRVQERYREKEIIKQRLASLTRDSGQIAEFIDENVRLFNGTKGDPRSFDLLDDLLDDQAYRLAYWRVASEEINYRRFFDINELAAIRMENPTVFDESHRLIFRLLKEGAVTGLRIDHVDGLYNPEDYLTQLQSWARSELDRDETAKDKPLYLLVEKILANDEPLPETWPVHGTTGYEFLNLLNGLFVNRGNERAFTELYARFTRFREPFDEVEYESKQLIMRVSMASELNVLGHQLNRLSERDRRSRDFTLNSLTHAIREIIACFPVYRTYIAPESETVSERDRAYIRFAVEKAKRRNPALSGLLFDFVRDLLLQQWEPRTEEDRQSRIQFTMKFQQTTSPVTAKGVEDTAFYLYTRLVSLNEVGGDPQQFGITPNVFHTKMKERRARFPHALSATSTHDTKRSEDVRARIAVLSQMPEGWKAHVTRWGTLNRKHADEVDGDRAPSRNDEYLLYQTLIGAWPFALEGAGEHESFVQRIQAYMIKAIREAKVHSSWVNPHLEYEDAVTRFIDTILVRSSDNAFLADFLPFQNQVAHYAIVTSLAQTLIKITAPGVPDFYQGTELWDLSLVDPDNRRLVDYGRRITLLDEIDHACGSMADRAPFVRELLANRTDGRIKLYLTTTALRYRRDHLPLFSDGEYVPLDAFGQRREHLCAFTRIYEDQAVAVIVPRLVSGLSADAMTLPVGREVWGDTTIAVPSWREGSSYRNIITGDIFHSHESAGHQVMALGEVLKDCPVAMLERIV